MASSVDRASDGPTLKQLETVIQRSLVRLERASLEGKAALVEISERRLYRPEHKSFEEYVWRRWKISRATAYRWLTQGRSLLELEAGTDEEQAGPDEPAGTLGEGETAGSGVSRETLRGEEPDPIDVSSVEVEPTGQTVLSDGVLPSEQTSNQGSGERGQTGSPGSPRAQSGAVAATEKAAESTLEVPKPTRGSIPPAGEDPAPSVPSPPSGPPMQLEVRHDVAKVTVHGRDVIARCCNEQTITEALAELRGALVILRGGRVEAAKAERPARVPLPRPDSRVPAAANGRAQVTPIPKASWKK